MVLTIYHSSQPSKAPNLTTGSDVFLENMDSSNQMRDVQAETPKEGSRDAEVESVTDGAAAAADALNGHRVALDKHRSNTVGHQVRSCSSSVDLELIISIRKVV